MPSLSSVQPLVRHCKLRACNSAGKRNTFRQETWQGGCCRGGRGNLLNVFVPYPSSPIPRMSYWPSTESQSRRKRKEDSRNISKRLEAVKGGSCGPTDLSLSRHWAASRGRQIQHNTTQAAWDGTYMSVKGNWVVQYHHMGTYHREINSIDLASLLLTGQHLSQNISDEIQQKEDKDDQSWWWKEAGRASMKHTCDSPVSPTCDLHWLSAWRYMCVCELTYGLNHCHPAHPLCSCRMGTFV